MDSSSLRSMGGAMSGSANCSVRSGKVLEPVEKEQDNDYKQTSMFKKKTKKHFVSHTRVRLWRGNKSAWCESEREAEGCD